MGKEAWSGFRWVLALVLLAGALGCGGSEASRRSRNEMARNAPPAADDWTTEYRGNGALEVSIKNGSGEPVFVKIRDKVQGVTAAQIPVGANASQVVQLGDGNFEIMLRVENGGRPRYYKGPDLPIPANTRGKAELTVGLGGLGQPLQEINAAEFNR